MYTNIFRVKAGVDEIEHFMVFHHYSDDVTIGLILAASEILGMANVSILVL